MEVISVHALVISVRGYLVFLDALFQNVLLIEILFFSRNNIESMYLVVLSENKYLLGFN